VAISDAAKGAPFIFCFALVLRFGVALAVCRHRFDSLLAFGLL
jgi:hypothetical protein